MVNWKGIPRRLVGVLLLTGLLAVVTTETALPLETTAGSFELVPQETWAGHSTCGAVIDVNLNGDPTDVGGYETLLTFDDAYLDYTEGNIALTDFLTAGGTRNSSGFDGGAGAAMLESVHGSSLRFGDFSWPASLPAAPGANAPGALASLMLDVVQCGNSTVSLSEIWLVDTSAAVLPLGAEPAVAVPVHHLLDVAPPFGIINAGDVGAVSARYFDLIDPTCGSADYMLDVAAPFGIINAGDVGAVAASYFAVTGCP